MLLICKSKGLPWKRQAKMAPTPPTQRMDRNLGTQVNTTQGPSHTEGRLYKPHAACLQRTPWGLLTTLCPKVVILQSLPHPFLSFMYPFVKYIPMTWCGARVWTEKPALRQICCAGHRLCQDSHLRGSSTHVMCLTQEFTVGLASWKPVPTVTITP